MISAEYNRRLLLHVSSRVKTALWLVWLAAAILLTAGIVSWHVEYFRNPGPQFYRAALVGLPLLAGGAHAWTWLRTRSFWRYELIAIIAIPMIAAALREPRATLVVIALFAACYCAGRALCERCGWTLSGRAADLLFSTASGFALLNTVLLASGLARIWYPWFFALVLAAPLVVFHRKLRLLAAALRTILHRWGELKDLQQPVAGILVPFAAILAACTSVLMLAPTLSWDAMKLHLPLAQHYLQAHALTPKPELDYSFFPQATESLFALAWSLGGQPAAQLISPLFFALSLLAAWIIARECGAAADEAFTGVMLAASLPVVHWADTVPKNDAQLTFYLMASLAAALRWQSCGGFRWVQAGTLFLACGFATKDPVLFGAIPLGAMFLFAACKEPRRVKAFVWLLLIFAAVALVWNFRRWILTGNPIYPLTIGESTVPGWPPDRSLSGTVVRMLRLPWDLHFHGHDFSETVLIAPLGIAFVLFWPVWLFTGRLRAPERLCLAFGIVGFLTWGWLSPLVRYAAAPLAVLAILTGIRLARFWRSSVGTTRATLGLASLWVLIPAVCAAIIVETNVPQLRYVAGRISRDEYLRQANIAMPSLLWLRDHTATPDHILGLENCADVYAPEYPWYQSYCAFRPWTAAEVEAQLHTGTFEWLVAPVRDREADLTAARTSGREASEVYRDANFAIYRLKPR